MGTWYSTKGTVHHNNKKCEKGNDIEKKYKQNGTGGLPLCSRCAALNQKSSKR